TRPAPGRGEPAMLLRPRPPPPLQHSLDIRTWLSDRRHAPLPEPLFLGLLRAHGRRTATAWSRAAGIAGDYRRASTLPGTSGRARGAPFAAVPFSPLRRTLDPGPRWLFAPADTPTRRYGPCAEGAGRHRNPPPGPARRRYLYGHVWVTTAW